MFNLFNGNKKITEKLYEQNLELAVKNKTLSLLEELYQKSVLNLTPEEVAKEITSIIRKDLNLDLPGALIFTMEGDSLVPLAFSKSERLSKTLNKLGFLFSDTKITDVSKREFFKKVVYNQQDNITNNLQEVWQELINQEHIEEIKRQSHIKTILLYPLIKGSEVLGVLMLGFNRDYNTLNTFEKASIKSFINVIALLLDKAYLYKSLQDSYEITKKAYALEKKAKEEIEKIDKFKDQFLMVTQHNLRTPLTSMMGYTDLLLKGFFGKQNKKTTEVIYKFQALTQGMIRMVNNFLDMAQFQLGKGVVALSPGVDALALVNEIVGELQFKAESKGIYIKLEKPGRVLTIYADKEKLKAAIFNIIDNAVKYTVNGGVTIAINTKFEILNPKQSNLRESLLVQQNSPQSVLIVVRDTGIGIPKEKLSTIFEDMFERTEAAKKVSSIGSGVGLYLAGQIIKAHKGKVWVESEGEGKGSVFHIEIPITNEKSAPDNTPKPEEKE